MMRVLVSAIAMAAAMGGADACGFVSTEGVLTYSGGVDSDFTIKRNDGVTVECSIFRNEVDTHGACSDGTDALMFRASGPDGEDMIVFDYAVWFNQCDNLGLGE